MNRGLPSREQREGHPGLSGQQVQSIEGDQHGMFVKLKFNATGRE